MNYYCMKCGAQCEVWSVTEKDKEIIDFYINELCDGKTVRFVSEYRTMWITNANRKLVEKSIDEDILYRKPLGNEIATALWRAIEVFAVVSYQVTKRETNEEKREIRIDTDIEFKLRDGYLTSRNSVDRIERIWDISNNWSGCCPICGEKLIMANDSWDYFFNGKREKNHHRYILDEYEHKRIALESEGYVEDVKQKAEIPMQRISAENVNVQSFLEHFINIEKNIMFLTEHLKALLPIQYRSERRVYREQFMTKILYEESLEQEKAKMQHELDAVKKQYPIISEYISEMDLGMHRPNPPILKTSNIFNRRRIESENAAATADYEQKLCKYMKDFEANKAAELERRRKLNAENLLVIKQEEERILNAFKQFEESADKAYKKPTEKTDICLNNEIYLAEIAEVKEQIQQLCKARAQLIASGIVYPKYMDFVALTTMYEYLETGRCTSLTGPDGAYNLYESEIRAERIIYKLDKVLDSLDQIKENQYKTYRELSSINSNILGLSKQLKDISGHTEAIAKNTAYIAYNTAKTAHYARINAELTNALGFMVALK